jgi:hypothetical protein
LRDVRFRPAQSRRCQSTRPERGCWLQLLRNIDFGGAFCDKPFTNFRDLTVADRNIRVEPPLGGWVDDLTASQYQVDRHDVTP